MVSLPSIAARRSVHDLTYSALEQELRPLPVPHARALWRALHRETEQDLHGREDFLPPLRRWVAGHLHEAGPFFTDRPEVVADIESSDGYTRKFLLKLEDGQTIETVLMGYTGRHTVCVSSQAGCAMGCVFCATGQMGFVRHLRPGEIVSQVIHAQRSLRQRGGEERVRNLVMMGMGEPLHNYEAVMTALEILSDNRGLSIGPRRMTISTVGNVPGIRQLAAERRPYNLAVSLHGATEEERSRLVPASKRWPLAELLAACREYCGLTGQRIFIEWTLIAGVNDSPAQAEQLIEVLRGMDAHVNMIPLNPTNGFEGTATAEQAAHDFQAVLRRAGLPATVRQRRGIDVAAGCGQLRAEKRSK